MSRKLRFWLRRFYRVRVTFSRDETLYYVASQGLRKRYWLTVEKKPIATQPADERRAVDGFMSDGLRVRKNDGETYWREAIPWTFYSVRAGETRMVRADDDLVLDYLSLP